MVGEWQTMVKVQTLEEMAGVELVVGLGEIACGNKIVTASSPALSALGIIDPIRSTRIHCCQLLNGFGWQPIHSVEEYLELVDEISAEYLPQFEQIQREYR